MSQKYLHHKSEESKVFDSDSQEYKDAQENGWSKDRQFPDKIDELDTTKEEDYEEVEPNEENLFRKNTKVQIVGIYPNGDLLIQNEDDDTDRWRIKKELFNNSYEVVNSDSTEDKVNDLIEEETISLGDMNVTELRKLAKEAGIPGCSKMSKEDCITKLLEAEGA